MGPHPKVRDVYCVLQPLSKCLLRLTEAQHCWGHRDRLPGRPASRSLQSQSLLSWSDCVRRAQRRETLTAWGVREDLTEKVNWSLIEEQEFAAGNGKGGSSWEKEATAYRREGDQDLGATQAVNQTKVPALGTSNKHTTRCCIK